MNGLLVRSALAGICIAPRKLKIKSAHVNHRQTIVEVEYISWLYSRSCGFTTSHRTNTRKTDTQQSKGGGLRDARALGRNRILRAQVALDLPDLTLRQGAAIKQDLADLAVEVSIAKRKPAHRVDFHRARYREARQNDAAILEHGNFIAGAISITIVSVVGEGAGTKPNRASPVATK